MVRGPYWICSVYYYLLLFSKLNHIFEGLNMLEKSGNFAHAPEVAKIYVWYGFQKWVWQNGSIAHLYTFNGVHLELRFTYKYKSWYTHVT